MSITEILILGNKKGKLSFLGESFPNPSKNRLKGKFFMRVSPSNSHKGNDSP